MWNSEEKDVVPAPAVEQEDVDGDDDEMFWFPCVQEQSLTKATFDTDGNVKISSAEPAQAPSYRSIAGRDSTKSLLLQPNSRNPIRLCRSRDGDVNSSYRDDACGGFVHGDFRSGKIHDIKLNSSCYTMKYATNTPDESEPSLLAVGMKDGISFYEAAPNNNYALVHHVATSDMVSGLAWLKHGGSSNKSELILSVGCMDGTVSLYRIDDRRALEVQGPTLVHQFSVDGQVRALDCFLFPGVSLSKSKNVALDASIAANLLVIAAGTKSGQLVLSSYSHEDLQPLGSPIVAVQATGGILGLSVHVQDVNGLVAWTTALGEVFVHELALVRDLLSSPGSSNIVVASLFDPDNPIWRTRRNGPVRYALFNQSGRQLLFGGYDKKIVLINTRVWAVTRELTLQGTVRIIHSKCVQS